MKILLCVEYRGIELSITLVVAGFIIGEHIVSNLVYNYLVNIHICARIGGYSMILEHFDVTLSSNGEFDFKQSVHLGLTFLLTMY